MLVQKRNNQFQEYEERKVRRAILMAFYAADTIPPDLRPMIEQIQTQLYSVMNNYNQQYITVKQIQEIIEEVLSDSGFASVSRQFMEYRLKRDYERQARLKPDPRILADYIHQSKYANVRVFHNPNDVSKLNSNPNDISNANDLQDKFQTRRETWVETCTRVFEYFKTKYDLDPKILDSMISKTVLPSMRAMQFAGLAIDKKHARLFNCSFTHIDSYYKFAEAIYLLLCGCGVGYSVQYHHVNKIPKLKYIDHSKVQHFKIPDSIEGWADAVRHLVHTYTHNPVYIEFDYSAIRPEGSRISTGGQAPGHLALKNSLENVRRILNKAQGRRLRPIECHDMLCFLAECVLSGGIRRSAMLALFSADDSEMFYAKSSDNYDPTIYQGHNYQRAYANNSVVLTPNNIEKYLPRVFNESVFGEPGYFYTENKELGTNPCGEITLNPTSRKAQNMSTNDLSDLSGWAFCNLTEINATKIQNQQDFNHACYCAATLGTIQASFQNIDYLTNVAPHRVDALLGVSITGLLDNPQVLDYLFEGRRVVYDTNKKLAQKLNINPARGLTCIKPSGTASLVLGSVSNGIHPQYARRYFRRIRVKRNDPLTQFFLKYNPHCYEAMDKENGCLVFPVQCPDDSILNLDAQQFMDIIERVYLDWIDNLYTVRRHNISVSMPLTDPQYILDRILESPNIYKAMALVPPTLDTDYAFAPLEKCRDDDRWNSLIKNMRPVPWSKYIDTQNNNHLKSISACDGSKCSF